MTIIGSVLLHSKVQLPLCTRLTNCNNVSYHAILNIKRFYIAMKHFHFKIRKTGGTGILIVVISNSNKTNTRKGIFLSPKSR